MLILSAATMAELCLVANQVAHMPHDSEFDHVDLCGAAIDMVGGVARLELDAALDSWGFNFILGYVEKIVPRYVGGE